MDIATFAHIVTAVGTMVLAAVAVYTVKHRLGSKGPQDGTL